jgi:iron complex transport system substrate-binding protein
MAARQIGPMTTVGSRGRTHRSVPATGVWKPPPAARPWFVVAMLVAAAVASGPTSGSAVGTVRAAADPPLRIVSLIPAVTEMIFAMGDGGRMVGVSNYDRFPPEVDRIRKVGGLLDPDVEGIISLKPDLVVVYVTQKELIQRLERARIPYFNYEHRALPDITTTIRAVGTRIGSAARADAVAGEMERSLAAIRASSSPLPHPSTMLVFGRDPSSLRNVNASGGYGFLHDMLEIAGGRNVFGDIKRQSVQASTEMILTRRPEVIIELKYGDSLKAVDAPRELQAWDALASVPAVKNHRVTILVGDDFVVPGPRVVGATRKLAATLHPEVFK